MVLDPMEMEIGPTLVPESDTENVRIINAHIALDVRI